MSSQTHPGVGLPWRPLGLAALAVGVLAYPAAWALDRAGGADLRIVAAADAASVEANRGLWELDGRPSGGVASIYGTPTEGTTRLVFADATNVLRPPEDPSLALYLLRDGGHPLQAQTLYFFALPTAIGAVLTGVALLLLGRRAAKRSVPAPAG